MTYSHTSFASFKAQLAARLGDVGKLYWPDSELSLYTYESLRLWNCAAQFNRARGLIQTTPGQSFYDLSTLANGSDNLLSRSVQDRDCIDILVAHLIESVNSSYVWTGTGMFTLDDLTNAIQRKVSQFLLETGMVLSTSETTSVIAGQNQITLSDNVIDVRRVTLKRTFTATDGAINADSKTLTAGLGFTSDVKGNGVKVVGAGESGNDLYAVISTVTNSGSVLLDRAAAVGVSGASITVFSYKNLFRTDEEELQLLYGNWSTDGGTPEVFSEILVQPRAVRIAPVPVDQGLLHLVTVNAGPTLDPSTGVSLGIPNDWLWVIKYGVLNELLTTENSTSDPARAAYSQQRWTEGIMLAKIANSVQYAEINGKPAQIIDLFDLDTTLPDWQHTAGEPTYFALAGHNLFALSPVPCATEDVPDGLHSIVLDVVRNAPLPVNDADFLQVGREQVPILLSYALHIASFKLGAQEVQETMGGYVDLLKAATLHSDRLRAQSRRFASLNSKVKKEEVDRPRESQAA